MTVKRPISDHWEEADALYEQAVDAFDTNSLERAQLLVQLAQTQAMLAVAQRLSRIEDKLS